MATSADRFEELLRRWQDGDASRHDLEELADLLKADPARRLDLVGSILLEVNLYARSSAHEAPETAPAGRGLGWRPRRIEAVAAVLAVAISLGTVAFFFLRSPGREAPHRVASGQVFVEGEPAVALAEEETFEVLGTVPATVTLAGGSRVVLEPGSSGAVRGAEGEAGVFELLRGGAIFTLASGHRVVTPAGSVRATTGEFSVDLRPLGRTAPGEWRGRSELVVAVFAGKVEVDSWGIRASLAAQQARMFGPAVPQVALDPMDYGTFLGGAGLTLFQAIDRALLRAPGTPLSATLEVEDDGPVFSVKIAQGNKVIEIDLNPLTGDEIDRDEKNEDESRLAAAANVPLKEILEKALQDCPGRPVKAALELKKGKAWAEVKIFGEGGLRKVKVNAENGEVFHQNDRKKLGGD